MRVAYDALWYLVWKRERAKGLFTPIGHCPLQRLLHLRNEIKCLLLNVCGTRAQAHSQYLWGMHGGL